VPSSQSGPHANRTVLANGVRVVTERLEHVDSVSLGISSLTGSRSDPPGNDGITHFLEHMLFKGTASHTARQIAEASDDIGGNVNGVTDREELHLWARTAADHTEVALELLFDLLLNSQCAEADVSREREVVTQEIANVRDVPEDWMQEMVPPTVWAGHPLGRPLMGTLETVGGIGPESLRKFLTEEIHGADRLLVVAAGRADHDQVVNLTERFLGQLRPGRQRLAGPPPVFRAGRLLIPQEGHQVHFCRVSPAIPRTHETRHTFAVLDTLLGGGSSSRLFQEIRENRGLAYDVGSYMQAYRDAGLYIVTGGAAPEKFRLVLDLVEQEIGRLRSDGPTAEELSRAKVQIEVGLALATESTGYRMHHLTSSEIYWGRVLSFEEINAGVERVTVEDVHELSQTALSPDGCAVLAIGPVEGEGG